MTGGFPGALGVVRVELSTGSSYASPPGLMSQAHGYAQAIRATLMQIGDAAGLVWLDYGQGEGPGVWLRARDVTAIEVIPTEDPGAGS